jgi:hypothetical protein
MLENLRLFCVVLGIELKASHGLADILQLNCTSITVLQSLKGLHNAVIVHLYQLEGTIHMKM